MIQDQHLPRKLGGDVDDRAVIKIQHARMLLLQRRGFFVECISQVLLNLCEWVRVSKCETKEEGEVYSRP